jgi:transposase-like protein
MPRKCSICRHPERPDIEAELKAGLPYRDIARRHDVSRHALWRHRTHHVSQHNAAALTTLTEVMALLHQAETAATWDTTLITLKEVRRCVEELVIRNASSPHIE